MAEGKDKGCMGGERSSGH